MATEPASPECASLLRTLANPQRLKILSLLAGGELGVGDLPIRIALAQSALSRHLAKLRDEKLVATRRRAHTIHCRIVDKKVLAMARASAPGRLAD